MRYTLGIMAALLPAFASSAQLAPICDDADHCVWIMENHGPHEFDYDLLSSELVGFGAEGKEYLIMLVGDKDAVVAGRAMDILKSGEFKFTREENRQILKAWPSSNLDKMIDLMVKVGSPDTQATMLSSLLHKNKKVREGARFVLTKMRENNKIYQLRPFEYGPIAKAVVEEPTRELVQMLAAFPKEKTTPILQRVLNTNDGPSIIAAYQALYEADKEMAFATLLKTLRELKDDQLDTAFALAELLRNRHKTRGDGFYMQFAKELAEDPEMTLMGRVVGVDTLINRQLPPSGSKVKLETGRPVLSALESIISARGSDMHPYDGNFANVASSDSHVWAQILWRQLQSQPASHGNRYRAFFANLGQIKSGSVLGFVNEALKAEQNSLMLVAALEFVEVHGLSDFLPQIRQLKNHWDDSVVASATITEKTLLEPKLKFDAKAKIEAKRTARRSCNIKAAKIRNFSKEIPYFTLEETDLHSIVKRRFIRSSYPTETGWLVGFDKGEWGGDIWYFHNEDGSGISLNSILYDNPFNRDPLRWSIVAIAPIRKPVLGSYASSFWVLADNNGFSSEANLYRIKETEIGWKADLIAHVPERGFQFNQGANDEYLLTHKHHSPIVLSPDGTLRPACQ